MSEVIFRRRLFGKYQGEMYASPAIVLMNSRRYVELLGHIYVHPQRQYTVIGEAAASAYNVRRGGILRILLPSSEGFVPMRLHVDRVVADLAGTGMGSFFVVAGSSDIAKALVPDNGEPFMSTRRITYREKPIISPSRRRLVWWR